MKTLTEEEERWCKIFNRYHLIAQASLPSHWENIAMDKQKYNELIDERMTLKVEDVLKTDDIQIGGSHYKNMPIQPIEFIVKNGIPYREANVIKYVVRFKNKNGLEDLKKARHYLDMLIEEYENES